MENPENGYDMGDIFMTDGDRTYNDMEALYDVIAGNWYSADGRWRIRIFGELPDVRMTLEMDGSCVLETGVYYVYLAPNPYSSTELELDDSACSRDGERAFAEIESLSHEDGEGNGTLCMVLSQGDESETVELYQTESANKVTVGELYSKEGEVKDSNGFGYGYSYHVPQIEDDTPDAEEINEEIALWYGKMAEDSLVEVENNKIPACNSVAYEVYHSGDILSLVLKCAFYYGHYEGFQAYNYDTAKGVRLTNEDLLAINGLTGKEYLYAVRRVAAKCYDDCYFSDWEDYVYDSSPGAYQERRLDTISGLNITLDLPLYPDDENVLRAVVSVGCHGDVDWIYEPLALDFSEDDKDVETAEYGDFLTVKRRGGALTLQFGKTAGFRDLLKEYDPYGTLGEPDVPYGREIEVNGLYGSYARIFCGGMGDPETPVIFLLTEEGRVEYMDVMDCLYAGYFCASGPLVGAENVGDFAQGSREGVRTIYALTESGERLDLNDLTMFDKYNMTPGMRGSWSDTRMISQDGAGSYGQLVSLTLSDGNGDNFELTYSQPGEEYVTGISGNLLYLGMTEDGAVYAYRGQGLHSNGPVCRGAIALSVKTTGIFDNDAPDTLYITELGGEPFIGAETGNVTQLIGGSGRERK